MRRGLPEKISLIPFVCGAGASIPGAEVGPALIKKLGLQQELAQAWGDVAWSADPELIYAESKNFYNTLPPLGSVARREYVLKNCRAISDEVERAVRSGALPVTLGGDHSMAAGTIAGFARAKNAHGRIGVIWVDAHADINTPDTTPSKALHGMPLSALLGLGDKDFATIGGKDPVLTPEHLVYIGLRSVDVGEKRRISDLGIHAFDMKDIEGADMKRVFRKALKAISKDIDYLVVSIDLDAFDPEEAPAVGSPVSGGLKQKDVLVALKELANVRPVDMIEIVEFNPGQGDAEKTYKLLRDILNAALGAETVRV